MLVLVLVQNSKFCSNWELHADEVAGSSCLQYNLDAIDIWKLLFWMNTVPTDNRYLGTVKSNRYRKNKNLILSLFSTHKAYLLPFFHYHFNTIVLYHWFHLQHETESIRNNKVQMCLLFNCLLVIIEIRG